jgi:5,6-dimethylbenzimidazole synthase
MMDYDGFLELLQKQRSIRRFKADPLPDEYIDRILEAARFAPSGANSQPWEIVTVKDKKIKDQIADVFREASITNHKLGQTRPREEQHPGDRRLHKHPGFQDAPVFFVLFSDPRLEDTYPMSAQAYSCHSITASSMANLFLYMHLAATTLGLASQWVTATSQPVPQALIKQLLGVPRSLKLYDTMVAGYPAQSPPPRLVREKAEFTHINQYDTSKYRTDTQVREFINTVHKLRTTIPD